MKQGIVILFFCFALITSAQTWKDVTTDYIINPSFEMYNYCPDSGLTLYSIYSCYDWYRPTQGTSDYYHPCGFPNITTTPVFWAGYQNPYDGEAYCGFLGAKGDGWFEYIQSKLLKPLVFNSKYKFSMRINRAEFEGSTCLSKIGAHFSQNNMQNYSTSAPYNFSPTILNNTGFICDTAEWVLVSGEFIAQGGEAYLTIGWFGDSYLNDFTIFSNYVIDSLTNDTLYVASNYYLVDSLKLYALEYDIENFNINTFSPNEDGINDYLDFSNYNLKQLEFTVFNRWGTAVFYSNDVNLKWDGRNNNGNKLIDGTYYYILKAITQDNTQITKHNFLTIFY